MRSASSNKAAFGCLATVLALACLACGSRGTNSSDPDPSNGPDDPQPSTDGDSVGDLVLGDFALREEGRTSCVQRDVIDVNLGHTPERLVESLHCQINGTSAPEDVLNHWVDRLLNVDYVRRIDVAISLCRDAGRDCEWAYSDPWAAHSELSEPCTRKTERDLGAVLMIWSDCPRGVNCDMDWANTHASGMDQPHALLGFEPGSLGHYNPKNPGWWRRQLSDARWAGLQFLLPNVFGPELNQNPDPLEQLVTALDELGDDVRIGLFDDTWVWGKRDEPPWGEIPDLSDPEAAAAALYTSKWKPFFSRLPSQYWYERDGRPFIYFYNAGTLKPREAAAGVIERMKQLFLADFSVEPFVVVDAAFFEDPAMTDVAAARFVWDTFRENRPSHSTLGGVTLDHFMVKWDSLGRDTRGAVATSGDRLVKGPELLEEYLDFSTNADVAVIATWNDLGEGTGIGRNYDYYYKGEWLPPNAFMSRTRAAQCEL